MPSQRRWPYLFSVQTSFENSVTYSTISLTFYLSSKGHLMMSSCFYTHLTSISPYRSIFVISCHLVALSRNLSSVHSHQALLPFTGLRHWKQRLALNSKQFSLYWDYRCKFPCLSSTVTVKYSFIFLCFHLYWYKLRLSFTYMIYKALYFKSNLAFFLIPSIYSLL